eukprot:gnl/TRDRNA2_/TRDRNA2_88196_c0_seq1.p1 gnl/TRDRNA2_/TRDRNA2_88196_c0~~gnl/TRDRNA2_/TRDRNA2_88196_c0_seq1.p1  ORF type:complete len:396 (-),score=62.16 gnl/TRDRNA2_/TRDRNA2_88196_c0_seq1:30-1043(-)
MLNHGEEPSCAQSFAGRRLVIRTVRPVAAGEELTIPYSELAEASCARRAWLREQYHFDPAPQGILLASVAKRDDLLSGIMERDSIGGKWHPAEVGAGWNAHHGILDPARLPGAPCCEGTVGFALLQRVHSAWQTARAKVQAGDLHSAAKGLCAAWDAASSPDCRLGDGHALRIALAREAMDVALDLGEFGDALGWARTVSAASRLVYSPDWPVVALSLARLAKLELYHGNHWEALDAGEEALRSLSVTYADGADILAELRCIVAQARAEAANGPPRGVQVRCMPGTAKSQIVGPMPPSGHGELCDASSRPSGGTCAQEAADSPTTTGARHCALMELD